MLWWHSFCSLQSLTGSAAVFIRLTGHESRLDQLFFYYPVCFKFGCLNYVITSPMPNNGGEGSRYNA